MSFSRPGNYPYPRDLKQVKDVEDYMKKLYASLIENDRTGDFLRDRAPSADLKALIVRPEWYGAKGDGVTDDTTAIQAAVTAAGEDGCVAFSDKTYLVNSSITLPSTHLSLLGFGFATIDTGTANSAFKQTNHGCLTKIDGFKFTGSGPGIEWAAADMGSSYYEYSISNCVFAMDASVWSIYLVGAREGTIENCYFTTGNGVYRSHSNVCYIRGCIFKSTGSQVGTAVQDYGDEVSYSCGLSIIDCVIMGYEYGVIIEEADDFNLCGSTIDYNTHNIRILGQDKGSITNCYLGSKGTNPAIYIGPTGTAYTMNILISNNKIVGHTTDAGYDCIVIESANVVNIIGNYIAFYTRYGISYDATTYIKITNNHINPRSGYGTYGVYATSDNNVNVIALNFLVTYGISAAYAQAWLNTGTGAGQSGSSAQRIFFTADDAQVYAEGRVGSDTTTHYPYYRLAKAKGSVSSPTDVAASHFLGGVNFYGYKNSEYRNAAAIIGKAVSVDTNIVEGKIDFYCTDAAGNQDIPLVVADEGIIVGTSGDGVVEVLTGTAPSSSATNGFRQYSADIVAGNAAPHFRTENGKVVKLYQQVLAAGLEEAYEAGELDSEAEIISALNTTNAKLNDLIEAIHNTGLLASS